MKLNKKRVRILLLLATVVSLPFGCGIVASLGKNPDGEALEQIKRHPNYRDGHFQNLAYADDTVHTKVNRLGMLKRIFSRPDSVKPPLELPFLTTNLDSLADDQPVVVWFGHSSVLIKHHGTNILIDPIFSDHAGPVSWIVKAFDGATSYSVEDMPPIDVVLISHDHYDHLDYSTMKKLKEKVKKVVVPVGVGSHLRYWGYKPGQIMELNWHQSYTLPEKVSITATPARHRSNRTLSTDKTLWASYVIQTGSHRIFYSGDGGYGHHFRSIGEQYGPFDLALMECGQYGPDWPHSHMFPPETARAAADLQALMMQPVHWAKFAESSHPWNDPIRQLIPTAKKLNIAVTVPRIGEPYAIGTPALTNPWWEMQQ